ncbi:aldo/keto reductase family oxidoreductase [Palleronia sp. LCG004]|uniref:aldo/keto reductase n=1 Tax=Palleronia sp. LCG004 TaxID=3079304 RepID=UPI002943CF9D|nr:aldo/keto reductase [Palleronia sp. LCG004]WOI57336.1 aldo/keto reductase [Palleronia sp. LCG004]
MDRVKITEDVSFSRIVYGMWRLGDDTDTSPEHVRAKIEACLEQGITTMDQADIYGGYMSEEILGRALTPELRDAIEIVTKCDIVAPAGRHSDKRLKHYDTSRAHIESSLDASLELMGVETVDLLLVHRPDPFMDHHETGAALDAAVAAGKARAVGVSNFKRHDWTLLQSAMKTPLVANQIEMSLAEISPFTNGDLSFIREFGAAPMAWSPLGGGSLMQGEGQGPLHRKLAEYAETHGCDIATIAVAWLLAHPAGILPVMGTNNVDRIGNLGRAAEIKLDRQDWFELYTLALGHEVP